MPYDEGGALLQIKRQALGGLPRDGGHWVPNQRSLLVCQHRLHSIVHGSTKRTLCTMQSTYDTFDLNLHQTSKNISAHIAMLY